MRMRASVRRMGQTLQRLWRRSGERGGSAGLGLTNRLSRRRGSLG